MLTAISRREFSVKNPAIQMHSVENPRPMSARIQNGAISASTEFEPLCCQTQ